MGHAAQVPRPARRVRDHLRHPAPPGRRRGTGGDPARRSPRAGPPARQAVAQAAVPQGQLLRALRRPGGAGHARVPLRPEHGGCGEGDPRPVVRLGHQDQRLPVHQPAAARGVRRGPRHRGRTRGAGAGARRRRPGGAGGGPAQRVHRRYRPGRHHRRVQPGPERGAQEAQRRPVDLGPQRPRAPAAYPPRPGQGNRDRRRVRADRRRGRPRCDRGGDDQAGPLPGRRDRVRSRPGTNPRARRWTGMDWR